MKRVKKILAFVLSIALLASNAALFSTAETSQNVSEDSALLYVDFEEKNANNIEGGLPDGEINGGVLFVEGFDGGRAVNITNSFGKTAKQYLKFDGVDMSDSYTLSFWYRENAVHDARASVAKTVVWNGFDNFSATFGGTIFSNTNTAGADKKGISMLNLPKALYATYCVSDGSTTYSVSNQYQRKTLQNIVDSRWHNVAVSVDRTANKVYFYVDKELTATQSISSLSGDLTDGDVLTLGADVLGQYGVFNSDFDEIMFFDSALSTEKIGEIYNKASYKKLINDVKNALFEAKIGTRFTAEALAEMQDTLSDAKQALTDNTINDYAAAYTELFDKYNSFLMGNRPNVVAIVTSDTHMGTGKDSARVTNNQNFYNILEGAKKLPYPATTLINAGDYDENRIDYGDGAFFDAVKTEFVDKVENAKVAVCVGNHQFTHPGNVGASDTTAVDTSNFRENCTPYVDATLEPNKSIVDAEGNLTKTYYYVFDGAAHYIVVDHFENSTRHLTLNITAEQLSWINSTLSYAQTDGKPIFLIDHYGPDRPNANLMNIIVKYDNVYFVSGDRHYGMGSNYIEEMQGYTWLELPATFYARSSQGFVGGGCYYTFIYDDCFVMRAYSPEDQVFMPEYDKVIYLKKDNYGSTTEKELGEEKVLTGLNKATATSYGYNATMRNTELTQLEFDRIIGSSTSVPGSVSGGNVAYIKDEATGDYNYNLYETPLSVMNGLINGKAFSRANKYNESTSTWKSTNISSEVYFATYQGNLALKEAVNAGKATYGTDPISVLVYEMDGKTNINSILLATGGIESKYTTRKYDIFLSDSMEDIFEEYNKLISFTQQAGNVNTVSTKWYYDWDNAEFTTNVIENQAVTWSNAQYIQFTDENVPQGKYIAWVAYDGGTTTYMRADISEFRIFTEKPYECTVNFNDKNGNLLKQISVPVGNTIREALSPDEISEIENLIPKIDDYSKGRTVLGETRLWNTSYDQPITGNTSFRAIYTIPNHTWDNGVVTKEATCRDEGVKTFTCTSCGDTKTEAIGIKAHEEDSGVITKAPTCKETGIKTYSCTVGGEVLRTEILPTASHSYTQESITKPATCTSTGIKEISCDVCGDIKVQILAAIDHSYKKTVTAPTCTSEGYTTYTCVCGDSYIADYVPKKEHNHKAIVTKKATCTANGIKTFTCACGDSYTETIAKLQHTPVELKAKAATCTKTGLTKGSKCSVCDTIITPQKTVAKKAHSYKTTTTKATLKKNGKTISKCTICGKTASTTTIYYAKTVKLKKATFTYTGKTIKPTLVVKTSKGKTISSKYYTVTGTRSTKKIGKHKITLKFKGNYSGTKTLYYTINPKTVASLKLKAGKKQMTVSYKKDSSVGGYEIMYATNKSFKKAKTTKATSAKKTIKKLTSKKTYYVKVRAYKKVSGKTYYGAYCKAKTVKVK